MVQVQVPVVGLSRFSMLPQNELRRVTHSIVEIQYAVLVALQNAGVDSWVFIPVRLLNCKRGVSSHQESPIIIPHKEKTTCDSPAYLFRGDSSFSLCQVSWFLRRAAFLLLHKSWNAKRTKRCWRLKQQRDLLQTTIGM